MNDTDGYFLDRPGQAQLRELLGQIPGLAEDLAIAVTRQDRIGRGGGGKRGRLDAPPLPVNLAAMDARDELHTCLAGWARLTCEQRQLDYNGQDTLIGVARWLTRWLIAVALTEGADEIIGDLTAAIRRCRKVIDIPPDPIKVDPARAKEAENHAHAMELNPRGIKDLGQALGGVYAELTARRLKYLRSKGKLTPLREIKVGARDPIPVYRVGDAIAAHLGNPEIVPSA